MRGRAKALDTGNFITPREISEQLEISYVKVLGLLHCRVIAAKKEKERWVITQKAFKSFKTRNSKRIDDLKKTYVGLYWQGLTHTSIQSHVATDFEKLHIVAPIKGFAESAIYEALKQGERDARNV